MSHEIEIYVSTTDGNRILAWLTKRFGSLSSQAFAENTTKITVRGGSASVFITEDANVLDWTCIYFPMGGWNSNIDCAVEAHREMRCDVFCSGDQHQDNSDVWYQVSDSYVGYVCLDPAAGGIRPYQK